MSIKSLIRKAIIIEEDITLEKASEIMIAKNISSIVYVNNRKIKGIITKEDLVKNFGKDDSVSNVMTKNVISVSPEDSVEKVIKLMKKDKISVVPVVDEKNNLLGVVGVKDLLPESKDGEFLFD